MYLRFIFFTLLFFLLIQCKPKSESDSTAPAEKPAYDISHLDSSRIPNDSSGALIRYGRELFIRTAYYLGPKGSVKQYTGNNGNCTNCHIDGGTRLYGNNLLDAFGRYPSYRGREGTILTIQDRINNCIERPMLGKPLPLDSREIKAIAAYFRWLGQGRIIRDDFDSTHLGKLTLIDRPADTIKGKKVYITRCLRCHNTDGQGIMEPDNIAYKYPPLWGPQAFGEGSSMNRNIMLAKYVKWTMPQDSVKNNIPLLSDAEAIDVAAYINTKSRNIPPDLDKMYPNMDDKQIDFPHGPFTDGFSEEQHRLGPWQPIIDARNKAPKK